MPMYRLQSRILVVVCIDNTLVSGYGDTPCSRLREWKSEERTVACRPASGFVQVEKWLKVE